MKKKTNDKLNSVTHNNSFLYKWRNPFLFLICLASLILLLYPMAFKGLRPGGVDVLGSIGSNHLSGEYQKETKETVLWNSNVFSGMPVYHRISGKAFNFDNILKHFLKNILYKYIWIYLIGFIGMFYLLRFFKISWWSSALCALGFILIPHYMSILSIGHFQKFRPVMYMPFVTFFFVSFINKKNLLWLLGFIFSFAVQIRTHHYQVVFYQILILIFFGLFYLINLLRDKKGEIVLKKLLLLIPACLLIIGMVAQPLFVTGEYTPYSIRGGTGIEGSTGLDTDYATRWSMHPLAVFNWVMPRFFGGTSQELYKGSAVPQLTNKKIPGYWGYMPFTQTYDYIGIIIAFLGLAGLITNWKKPIIKLLTGLFALCLLLSFGRHLQFFYNIFFYYVPAFNKFRVPAMLQLVMFLLSVIYAGFGLDSILKGDIKLRKNIIAVVIILLIAGLVPYIFGNSFNMIKADEYQQYGSQTAQWIADARLDMMQSDGLRLIIFTLAAGISCLLYLTRKIKPAIFLIILLALMLVDQIPYLKKAEGELTDPDRLEEKHFRITKTNQIILQDTTYYRVFPITENPFNSNDYAYYHNSIGGYNAAKLRIYQDIIESCLYKGPNPQLPINWNILKMLNTKYLISSQALPEEYLIRYYYDKSKKLLTYKAKYNTQPAWFVSEYRVIPEREERFTALNDPNFDVHETAILESDPQINVKQPDSSWVKVTETSYNRVSYQIYTDNPCLFVASEIYYPAGWKCYVDSEEKPIYKTNHILRSVYIDQPGIHKISFVFEPETYFTYLKISKISHWIAWILLIFAIVISLLNKKRLISAKQTENV